MLISSSKDSGEVSLAQNRLSIVDIFLDFFVSIGVFWVVLTVFVGPGILHEVNFIDIILP